MQKKLTPKQQRFVEEYLVDLNATQACVRAGYSKKTAQRIGSENLSKPLIAAEIKKGSKIITEKTEVSAESIVTRLNILANRCMQAEPVTDKDGNPIGDYKFDSSGANKALELLGKTKAMFVDKIKTEDTTKHEFWTKLIQKVGAGKITKNEAIKILNEEK